MNDKKPGNHAATFLRAEIAPVFLAFAIFSVVLVVSGFLLARANKRPQTDAGLLDPASRLLHRAIPGLDHGRGKNELTLCYCTDANGHAEYFLIDDQNDSRYPSPVTLFQSLESAANHIAKDLQGRTVMAAEPLLAFDGPPTVRDWRQDELAQMHKLLRTPK